MKKKIIGNNKLSNERSQSCAADTDAAVSINQSMSSVVSGYITECSLYNIIHIISMKRFLSSKCISQVNSEHNLDINKEENNALLH